MTYLQIILFLKYVVVSACSIFITLLSRFIWDRYLSQNSRITRKEFNDKLSEIDKRLDSGVITFKHINICLITTCLILLRVCEEVGIDCEDIKKVMIENGLNL